MKRSKEKLKVITEKFLQTFPETRDSDTALILSYLYKKGLLSEKLDSFDKVFKVSKQLPGLMGLGRWRADFQNKQDKYLGTKKEVREEEESDWREVFKK